MLPQWKRNVKAHRKGNGIWMLDHAKPPPSSARQLRTWPNHMTNLTTAWPREWSRERLVKMYVLHQIHGISLSKCFVFIWLLYLDQNDQIFRNKITRKIPAYQKLPFYILRYFRHLPRPGTRPYIPQAPPFETQQKPNTQQQTTIANDNEKYTTITQAKITAWNPDKCPWNHGVLNDIEW